MNRSLAAMVLLVALAGASFAGEPTPAQRSTRSSTSAPTRSVQPRTPVSRPQADRPVSIKESNLIGAGVKRSVGSEERNSGPVKQASANTNGRVVKANAQVMSNEVIYEDGGQPMHDGGYVVNEPMASGTSCESCGSGSCDGGSCGASCGPSCDTSGFGSCGFDLCSPGPGRRRQLCICLPSHGWVQLDYLMWWQRGMNTPPLLTTRDNLTTSANERIALGDELILTERMNGGRIRFGWWFANCPKLGIEGEYFGFKQQTYDERFASANAAPFIGRPFFNINRFDANGQQLPAGADRQDIDNGSFRAVATSTLDGAAVRFRRNLCCSTTQGCAPLSCCPVQMQSRIDATVGWRFLQLREELALTEVANIATPAPARALTINDEFKTRNQFNGAEIGVLWQGRRGYWTLDGILRTSFGNNLQKVDIRGSTASSTGTPASATSGFLALDGSNVGTYERSRFNVVPEFGATLGYQLTPQTRLTAGYSFIYWSSVVRPGDQIDTDINPALLPTALNPVTGALRPAFAFQESDYWVQGVNLGLERKW